MAYNKTNRLRRIVQIQDLVLEHKRRGVTQLWVYENIVWPQYRISISCFKEYLSINAKRELQRLKEQQDSLPTLF